MSAHSTVGEPLDVGVDEVGEPVQVLGARRRARAPPTPGTRRARRAPPGRPLPRRRARPRRAPRRRSARSSRSSARSPRARPPMKWSVETSSQRLASSELLDGLEVVDRVGEREAVAPPDLDRARAACAPRRARRSSSSSRVALPDLGHRAVAAARAHELVDLRVVVAAGGQAREVADVDDRRRRCGPSRSLGASSVTRARRARARAPSTSPPKREPGRTPGRRAARRARTCASSRPRRASSGSPGSSRAPSRSPGRPR